MPYIWTHSIYAELVTGTVGIDIQKHKNILQLGAQGPDPLFYHRFWPWAKKDSMEWLGLKLHNERCGSFLMDIIDYAREKNDSIVRHYVMGFVCHHILDRNAHPFVIYRSGIDDKRHAKMEVAIDTFMAKDHYGIDTWKTPVYRNIHVGKKLPPAISTMLSDVIDRIYEINISGLENIIQQSYTDMIRALKFLFDPFGVKNKIFGNMVRSYSYSKNDTKLDLLNRDHLEWAHPVNESEKSTESFHDIWDRAIEEGILIIETIKRYFDGEQNRGEIENLIGDISYETGKPCSSTEEIRFFDPIPLYHK